ncbi:MAG TPA: aldo/keto reductase [Xanthobacteraceae bacterium]|nr:aldo/keto reductase [Xanthobacteraceae bacterium]
MAATSVIPKRRLGRNGPEVSAIGAGMMSLSGIYGASSDEDGIKLIHHALDRGVNFLDTADVYGAGHNEQLVGRAIRDRRDKVFLASKFSQLFGPSGPGIDGRPEYVASACEASLKRLGVDTIDLYFQHRVDPKVPIEETVGAMAKLVKDGKVRYLGLSEPSPESIRRAHATHPITAVESEYSLMYRKDAEESLVTMRELGIGYVAYAPLGRSFLTGTLKSADEVMNDRRADHPRFKGENFAHNLKAVSPLEAMAQQKGCTPAQIALAWVLAQGDDIVPIPGTRRIERFEENLGALAVTLSADDLKTLSDAFPPGVSAGARYPEGQMKSIYV